MEKASGCSLKPQIYLTSKYLPLILYCTWTITTFRPDYPPQFWVFLSYIYLCIVAQNLFAFAGSSTFGVPWVPRDLSGIVDQSFRHQPGSFPHHVCWPNSGGHFTNFHLRHSTAVGRHLVPFSSSFFSLCHWCFWQSSKLLNACYQLKLLECKQSPMQQVSGSLNIEKKNLLKFTVFTKQFYVLCYT